MEQLDLFTFPQMEITKPIRLIELFGGIGSQAMALRDIGADFEHYRLVEFDKYAVQSYNAIHNTNFEVTDIKDVHGIDLGIKECDKFTYLLTYLLTHSHAQIYRLQEKCRECPKMTGSMASLPAQDSSGKLKESYQN